MEHDTLFMYSTSAVNKLSWLLIISKINQMLFYLIAAAVNKKITKMSFGTSRLQVITKIIFKCAKCTIVALQIFEPKAHHYWLKYRVCYFCCN